MDFYKFTKFRSQLSPVFEIRELKLKLNNNDNDNNEKMKMNFYNFNDFPVIRFS